MLSQADLPLRLLDDRAYLEYLGAQDEPWLRVLVAELQRFEGRRRRELAERLAEPLPCDAPYFKRRAASRVLFRLWNRAADAAAASASADSGDAKLRPAAVRAALFGAAAAKALQRPAVVAEVAARFGVAPDTLDAALFADLPGERPVRAPDPVPTPAEIALHTNLALAQAVVMRAAHVSLRVEGGLRPIVRLAKFRGLLCNVAAPAPGAPARLDISGPFSLFRHTLIYGRALAELLPHLAWCARFELAATARLRGRLAQVTMESGDPIFPARAPAPFDSRLEERFAKDFARLAPDWDVIREPLPLQAGATLIFPDFLVRHRIHQRAPGAGRDRRLLDARLPDREARPPAPAVDRRAAGVRALHRRGARLRAIRAAARASGGDVPPPRRRRRRHARSGAADRGRGARAPTAIIRMTVAIVHTRVLQGRPRPRAGARLDSEADAAQAPRNWRRDVRNPPA